MVALLNMPRAAWKRQPTHSIRQCLNASNPLTRGLVVCVSGASLRSVATPFGLGTTKDFVNTSNVAVTNLTVKNSTVFVYSYFFSIPEWSAAGYLYTDTTFSYPNDKGIKLASAKRYGSYTVFSRDDGNSNRSATVDLLTGDLVAGTAFKQCLSIDDTYLVNFYDHVNGRTKSAVTTMQGFTYPENYSGAVFIGPDAAATHNGTAVLLVARWQRVLADAEVVELYRNPWQLFAPSPSRFYLIPSSGGSTNQNVSIDALLQRAGLTQSTSIDALLQSAFSRSLSLDSLIAAVQAKTISLDALLQIVGTRTVSIDALLQAVKSGTVSVDALVQMTLAQSLSLDALIIAASASSASTDLDAFIQALKTAGISLDALLSQSKTATAVIDALIQASKAGTVSLDAIIAGASSTTVFVGLDALIQAIQSKTLSVDALLQKTYTNPLSLDAYVSLTQIKTVSLDALLQNTKTGVISMDAILQMTKTAMVSFDALIQAAKTGILSLDAILVFATQASVLLDAYVQKAVLRGVGLDAIIGAIADMVMPTGRVVAVPASDRWVFVTPPDRFIQV